VDRRGGPAGERHAVVVVVVMYLKNTGWPRQVDTGQLIEY
jgi:hypothetical protein